MMAQVNAGRVRFVGRGEYNNSTQYYVFDLVNYNGNSYYAKADTIGHLPTDTTYWQLVAEKGNVGPTGLTGNGISSIEKTSTSGLVDTYTITFTNGNTTTFDVSNGNGIDRIEKTATVGNIDTYTIYFTNGSTTTYEVANGEVTREELEEEVDRLSMIYNLFPTTSDEDTEMTLDGTGEVKLKKIGLKGNTYQKTSILPSEYTQVDYIECSGTQYIDTNYIIKNESRVETEILVNSIDNQDIFGMDNRTDNVLILNFENNNISCRYGTYTAKKISATDMMNKWIKISYSKQVYINDVLKTSFDAYDFSNNTLTFRVGRARNGVYSKSKYKYLKLYDNNVLVRNLIPCYRNSDNEVGLYDLVNDVFYTNQGTGAFTYGSVATIPNPDYPQDIQVVSGDNTIKVEGKNLLNANGIYSSTSTTSLQRTYENGIATLIWSSGFNFYMTVDSSNVTPLPIDNTKTYTLSFYHKGNALNLRFDESNTNIITTSNDSDYTRYTYTFTNLSQFIIKFVRSDNTGTAYLKDFQIEKGSTATTYEPYVSQSYPISLGNIELCKIGDYQDYIYKNNGKWYLNKQIGKVVLDGSENYTQDTKTGYSYYLYGMNTGKFPNYARIDGNTVIFNKFKGVNNSAGTAVVFSQGNNICCFRYNSGDTQSRFYITSSIDNIDDFKTDLLNNNAVGYYVLTAPIVTEITDTTLIEQLDNLEKAYSYDTQTNISQTNADKPFILDVEAILSLKNIFN